MKNILLTLLLLVSMTSFAGSFTTLNYGRALFVANSGSDLNPGTEAKPLATPAACVTKINLGIADSCIFARGSAFALKGSLALTRSGSSAQKVTLAAYGAGPRPILSPYGINNLASLSYIAITGLHLVGSRQVGGDGIRFVGLHTGTNILIEDNEIEGFFNNITFQTGEVLTQLTLNRNVIHDTWAADPSKISNCAYIENVNGLTLSQNVFDRCGWTGPNADQMSMFNHCLYAQQLATGEHPTTGIIAQGNIVTNSGDAWQMRMGGIANQNFLDTNSIGITFHQSQGSVTRNVILHSNDISASLPRGIGILLDTKNPQDPGNKVNVSQNMISFYDSAKSFGMAISSVNNPSVIAIAQNTWFGFPAGIVDSNSPHVSLQGNIQKTASLDIGDYLKSLGIANGRLSQFVTSAKLQSSSHWNEAYTGEAVTTWFLSH